MRRPTAENPTEDTTTTMEQETVSVPQTRVYQRVGLPPSVISFLWGDPDVVRYKFELMFLGIGELLFVIPIWVMWALAVIPSVTLPWRYCGLYFVVFAPIWIVNIYMSDSRSKELFLFSLFANAFVFGVTTFVYCLLLYDVIACWLGQLAITCRDTMLPDLIVTILTFFLWIITLVLFFRYLGIIGRIRQTNSIRRVVPVRRPVAY
jgi:hypothetical protein